MSALSLSLRDDRGPAAAVEIAGHRISAARLETRGGRPVVAAYASEPLPEGTLVPALTTVNVRHRAAAVEALSRVLAQIGQPRRVGLVVPDPVAKVSLIRFQQVPARPHELDELIRWQIRKTSPFPLEEAQVSYAAGGESPEGREFLVSVARRDILGEYELLCAEAGVHAGLVDLSTISVINAVLAGGRSAADCLLVNVARDWASLAILRGGHVVLFRSRASEGDGTLADLVHQTAMYYEDRLSGSGFGQVLVCGATSVDDRQGSELEHLRQSLTERLNTEVNPVDPRMVATLTDRISAGPTLLDTLAPLVGLLARGRETAA